MKATLEPGITLDENALADLKAALRGELIGPEDEAYEQARRVYNGMIDKHPRLVARSTDLADVIAVVNFARDHDLLLAVRGGGHNGAGLGVCDGGVVLDLSLMNGIRVDPDARTIRAEGGCTQGAINHAGAPFGLVVPAGIVSTTGIGGLTLGGGQGYLARKYGLTIDNLLEADVVLANGQPVTASERQNADLFWALRGGGGNFGVVTSFLFQARPVGTVVAGLMLWDFEQTAEMMRWYREFLPAACEDLSGIFAVMNVPPIPLFPVHLHGRTFCGVIWCHLGPRVQAEKDLDVVRESYPPAFEQIGPMPITVHLSRFDALLPPGLQWYWKGDFFTELSDEAIEQHVKYGAQLPTLQSMMHLHPIDGRVNRVPSDATAFSFREAKYSMVIAGVDPDPAHNEKISTWAQDYWNALHPYSAGGAYVNFMMEEGADRVQATYRGNYERLAALKAQYDPGNVFRVNQNIRPQNTERAI